MDFTLSLLMLSSFAYVTAKVYERCELANELKTVHRAPLHQLATWVCIARYESEFKTDAVGHLGEKGTADHGIFQINDRYWCSTDLKERACRLTCNELEDDDITDDFECAQKIYKEHKILSGDGFNAWVVYKKHCKGDRAAQFLKGCFGETNSSTSNDNFVTGISHMAHKFFNKENMISTISKIFRMSTHPMAASTTPRSATTRTASTRNQNNGFNFFKSTTSFSGIFNSLPKTTFRLSTKGSTTTKPTIFSNPTKSNKPLPLFATTSGHSHFPKQHTTRASPTGSSPHHLTSSFRPMFIFNGVPWY
ncbi:hypothetical protein RUM44_009913 [Polyplax serrata]|uniref:lysozyme n=1 Tax=Polyplax serrata TaxID=468196 RepID=A0ABR1AU27_POLSC